MKSRSLTPCILLSILVILFLSTAAQATEYREVKAEEILKHIENGEEVNYTNCRIVGELNTSNIKLKTIPNPHFSKVNEEFPKELLIKYFGLSENLHIIESNITIKNSTFENGLNFSSIQFNNSAYFYLVTFNNSANFRWTTFKNSADFTETTFNNYTYFYGATFKNSADFTKATFNNSADFGVPDTSENIITGLKNYQLFMKSYNDLARYSDADNIYYNFRKDTSLSESFIIINILSWVTCGYGTKLSHTLYCSIFFIIVFAYIYRPHTTVSVVKSKNNVTPVKVYWKESGIFRLSDEAEKKSILSFWDALYFSINTFTRLGSADWHARENFRKWVALEGLLGWVMLAIVSATLMRLFIRL